MKINPINNITKKVLPLAASVAIGLGAMTACSSSSKNGNQEPTYLQTEILNLSNSLDSLKSTRGDGDKAFFDYYEKSKNTIDNAKLHPYKAMDYTGANTLTWGGIIVAGIGLLSALNLYFKNGSDNKPVNKLIRAAMATSLLGLTSTCSGIVGQDIVSIRNHKKFSNYKEQVLNNLELEKIEYLNTNNVK